MTDLPGDDACIHAAPKEPRVLPGDVLSDFLTTNIGDLLQQRNSAQAILQRLNEGLIKLGIASSSDPGQMALNMLQATMERLEKLDQMFDGTKKMLDGVREDRNGLESERNYLRSEAVRQRTQLEQLNVRLLAAQADYELVEKDAEEAAELARKEIDALSRERNRLFVERDKAIEAAKQALDEAARAKSDRDLAKAEAVRATIELGRLKGERVVSAVFGHQPDAPRVFSLYRKQDVSGVSGTGIVALGVEFPDGTVILRWGGDHPATAVWDSLDEMIATHGHGGKTEVVWLSEEFENLADQEEREARLRKRLEDMLQHYLSLRQDAALDGFLKRLRTQIQLILEDKEWRGAPGAC